MSNCGRKISLLESHFPNGDGYSRDSCWSRSSPTLESWRHHPPETAPREGRRKPPVLDPLKTFSPLTSPCSPSVRFAHRASTEPTRCSKKVVLHRSAPSNADLSLPGKGRRGRRIKPRRHTSVRKPSRNPGRKTVKSLVTPKTRPPQHESQVGGPSLWAEAPFEMWAMDTTRFRSLLGLSVSIPLHPVSVTLSNYCLSQSSLELQIPNARGETLHLWAWSFSLVFSRSTHYPSRSSLV